MFLLFLAGAVAADPTPGPFKSFGDWAVACDNVRRCEMTSLEPTDGDDDSGGAELSLVREPGPNGEITITLWPGDGGEGPLTLTIDGAQVASGTLRNTAVEFGGATARRIAAALAAGHRAQLSAGGRTATLSLAGASAALRFVDAQQGRADGVTALVARGPRPAGAVPVAPALPVVAAAPLSRADPALPAGLIARLNKTSGCGDNYSEGFAQPDPETGALGGGATLVLLACGSGAYNLSSAAYVVRGGKATPARFDTIKPAPDGSAEELINASWDAGTGTLSSYAKGRGLADCGEAASYAWDGTRFRAVQINRMDECRGSTNWLTVWRAKVRRR